MDIKIVSTNEDGDKSKGDIDPYEEFISDTMKYGVSLISSIEAEGYKPSIGEKIIERIKGGPPGIVKSYEDILKEEYGENYKKEELEKSELIRIVRNIQDDYREYVNRIKVQVPEKKHQKTREYFEAYIEKTQKNLKKLKNIWMEEIGDKENTIEKISESLDEYLEEGFVDIQLMEIFESDEKSKKNHSIMFA